MKLRDPIDEAILSMEDELLAMGYEYAAEPIPEVTGLSPDGTLRYVIQFPENRSAAGLCDEWQIDSYNRYNGRQETVYAANDTHALSNLNVLDDGSMLFVRWLREDCRLSNPLQLELLRLTPDGALRLVTERISTATSNLSTLTNINRRYTVSNNGRYVVWISGSENDNDNALEIADLHTGKSTSLIRFDVTARLADLRFLSVTWIE
jgi:hypothetical protein